MRPPLLSRLRSGVVLAVIAIGPSPAATLGQTPAELDLGDEVHYPWTFTGAPGGFGSSSVENQTSRVLTVPVSIWLRRLTDGRELGLRLRLTGVLGFQDFQRIEDFEIKSIRLGGLFPGIEFLIPLNDRSLLPSS